MKPASDQDQAGPPALSAAMDDIQALRHQLKDAQQVLNAIAGGEVDALVIQTPRGKRIYTLQGADEPYRLMVEQMREGAVTISSNGAILYTNRCFAQVLGRPLNKVIGSNIREHLVDSDRFVNEILERSLEAAVSGDFEIRNERGEGIPVQISVVRMEIQDQRCFCLTVVDLTLQRRQEQLRQSEARFRLVAEALPQIVWTAGPEGRIDYFNRRWGEFTSSQPHDGDTVTGFEQVLHPDDAAATAHQWRTAVASGHMYDVEHRLRRHDGCYHWHLSRALPVRDDQGGIITWFGTSTDIEQQKSTEQSLKLLTETLELRVAERTELAERRATQLREAASELVQTEQRERRRLAQVLHDHLQQLLVAAKMKAGVMGTGRDSQRTVSQAQEITELLDAAIHCSRDLTAELCPPILLVHGLPEALRWLASQMDQKHDLRIDVKADFPCDLVLPEPVRDFIYFTARELLFNVAKHADSPFAQLTLGVDGGFIELAVIDEGKGCEPSGPMPSADSRGYGLFNIRHRSELWNGEFQLHSRHGSGCRALLRLPVTLATPIAPGDDVEDPFDQLESATADAAEPGAGRIRLLVADDHAILRQGLVTILRQQPDLEVIGEATDGQEAVELTRLLAPDLVLMDVTMPRMGGIEATSIVRRQMPRTRVIGLSMHDELETNRAMRNAGADAFLTKGQDFDLLLRVIRDLCPKQPG